MFFTLTSSVKRRMKHELKDFFGDHPIYRKICPFIQNKFVFEDRPQYGIIVKAGSVDPVLLSPDHFVGTVISHCMLTRVRDKRGMAVEWVREDAGAINDNQGYFPSAAGVYFVEVERPPSDTTEGRTLGRFVVDVFPTVHDEPILSVGGPSDVEGHFSHVPAEGTVFAVVNRNWPLSEGVEFEVDYDHGRFRLLREFDPGSEVFVDYRYFDETRGPFEFDWNSANNTAIPGVILAFGKRSETGDKQAVVVTEQRVETADEFGGQNEITIDFEVLARDEEQMGEIADLVFFCLWAERRLKLADDGMVLTSFSMSGEIEDVYDETEDSWYYTTPFSITFRTDWAIHVPKPLTIRHVSYMSHTTSDQMALLNDEQAARLRSSIRMDRNLGLTVNSYLYMKERTFDFESIT